MRGSNVKKLDATLTGYEGDKLEWSLRKRIVGQDEAIRQVINIYQTFLTGLSNPGRPLGNFLFLGPTGSGKTRMVEAVAESLVGTSKAVVKIDCAEFQLAHEIAKLIGSPPGYLGHRETNPALSQQVLDQYHTEKLKVSFVLFDEIEKASDALWNLLLGIMDKACLTLGDNRKVDFSRTMLFLTSNLGAAEMGKILRPNLGFAASEIEREQSDVQTNPKLIDKITRAGIESARRKFTPEFMNRLDKTIVFRPLGKKELRQILKIELDMLQQRIFNSSAGIPFVLSLTDQAYDHLLQVGTDMKYGARHLKRAIDRLVVHPLSNLIATQQVHGGDLIEADLDPSQNCLVFFKTAEDMPAYAMVQMTDTDADFPDFKKSSAAASANISSTEERRRR